MSALAHPREPAFTFDAFDEDWSCRREGAAPCVVCGRPAWCVNPSGQPAHRVDCIPTPPPSTPADVAAAEPAPRPDVLSPDPDRPACPACTGTGRVHRGFRP